VNKQRRNRQFQDLQGSFLYIIRHITERFGRLVIAFLAFVVVAFAAWWGISHAWPQTVTEIAQNSFSGQATPQATAPQLSMASTPQATSTNAPTQVPNSTLALTPTRASPVPTPTLETPAPPVAVKAFSVVATAGWKDIEVSVKQGERVRIQYVSGTWSDGITPSQDGSGGPNAVMCVIDICPMRNYPEGMLVGRIGNRIFAIGNDLSFVSALAGTLQVRMNDSDQGSGDNSGEIQIQITVSDQP